MSVDHTIVKRLTADDLAAIATWTADVKAARDAYRDDPQAPSRSGSRVCRVCKSGRHDDCTTQAWPRTLDKPRVCSCWLDDHSPTRRTA